MAFIIVQNGNVKLMNVEHESCIDKLLEYVPDLIQKMNEMFNKSVQQKDDRIRKIINEMRNKNFNEEKAKSSEVREQEKKVAENEKKSDYQNVTDFIEADGEKFEE